MTPPLQRNTVAQHLTATRSGRGKKRVIPPKSAHEVKSEIRADEMLQRKRSSDFKGVCWDKSNRKWKAQLTHKRKNYSSVTVNWPFT